MASSSVFKPAGLSEKTAKAAVSKALIQGTSINDQFDAMTKAAQKKFTGTVLHSIQSGETLAQLAARVSGGTVAGEAVPGFLSITRQQSIALSHTAVTAVSKQDRLEAFRANSDIISAIQQVSTLDNRTTDICIAYSDLTWDVTTLEPIGHSLPWAGGPPRHFNCRSVIVPVVKSPAELGVKTRAKIPDEVRATMDGQKSSSLTFTDWLKGKSENFQNEVLGVKKAQLFREGKLKLQDLINFNATPKPIKSLEKVVIAAAPAAPIDFKKITGEKERKEALAHIEQQQGIKDLKNGITAAERSALDDYALRGYNKMNYQLRYGGLSDDVKKNVELLDSLIEKAGPLPNDVQVYRIATFEDGFFKPGSEFVDKAFLSTSADPDFLIDMMPDSGELYTLKFVIPKGAKAVYVDGEEFEFLLPRGSKFNVVSVGKNRLVTLELIQP